MSGPLVVATARRVLTQIRHDRRTIALLLVVPTALPILLRYVLDGRPDVFKRSARRCAVFPFIVVVLVTSIAMTARADERGARAVDDAAWPLVS